MIRRIFVGSAIVLFAGTVCLAGINVAKAGNVYYEEKPDSYEVTILQGTFIKAVLLQKLSSAINNVGDSVQLIVQTDFLINDVNAIPQSTVFSGEIVRLERAKLGQNGLMQILIKQIEFPDGRKCPMVAHLYTKYDDGIIGGELTKRAGYRKVPHYVEGLEDYVQFIPSGPRQQGNDTVMLPGSEWLISLDSKLRYSMEKTEEDD